MSVRQNIGFVASELNKMSSSSLGEWLRIGVEGIVLEGVYPPEAFKPGKYMIGIDDDAWKADLVAIREQMQPTRRRMMNVGLREAIDLLPPDLTANEPGAHGGRNSESLALTYLSLARAFRSGEALTTIDGLVRSKFPKSVAVYAASIYTWRVLATYDSVTDWRSVFLPEGDLRKEPRFQLLFSAPIVFGMCAAQPRRTAEFMTWQPFRDHVAERVQNLSDQRSLEDLHELLRACETLGANILRNMPQLLTQIDVMEGQLAGKRGRVVRIFNEHRAQTTDRRRSLRLLAEQARFADGTSAARTGPV